MMLWFVLLLLLFRAPGSESRLLPRDQLRATKGLCDEEAVSDSLVSSTATLFGLRSLLADSDQFPSEIIDPDEQKTKENRVMSEKELRSEPASIQSPSNGDHLIAGNNHASLTASEISNTLASTPSNGNNLVTQQHEKKNRAPPSFTFERQIFTNLQSVPSGGDHLVVESFHFESEILSKLGKGSAPSAPSGTNHLAVEKRQRSPPPPSVSESEILNNLGKGSTPSTPSGGNNLVAEKRTHRSPSTTFQTLVSEPSGKNHLTVQQEHDRAPPAYGSEIIGSLARSTPSSCNHLVGEEKKVKQAPPAVDSEEGLSNREVLMKLASTPSSGHQKLAAKNLANPTSFLSLVSESSHPNVLVAEEKKPEPFQKLDSVPSGLNYPLVENVKGNSSPPKQKPPRTDHEHESTVHTETTLDASMKILNSLPFCHHEICRTMLHTIHSPDAALRADCYQRNMMQDQSLIKRN